MNEQASQPTPPPIYGDSASSAAVVEDKTFRQRLTDLFGPTDFVRVLNIDDEVFWWQYLPSSKEHQTVNRDYTDFIERELPEQYSIEPGQSKVLMGENAYLMLEGLYKRMASKKVIQENPDVPKGQARNFNFTDGGKQEAFITQAYLGKENPFAQAETRQEIPKEDLTKQVDEDLGLEPVEPAPGTGFNYDPATGAQKDGSGATS